MLADPTRRAGVFIDESWFVLWPHPTAQWARCRRPVRLPKNKSWRRTERPPSCALYAGMDVVQREVRGEWHPTWNQEETWRHLQGVITAYAAAGMRYLVVFWDHGPWHTAASVARHLADYNRMSTEHGGMRVGLCYLPVKAPWLMPLEPVFGQTKRAVGSQQHTSMDELHAAVDRRLHWRNGRVHQHTQHPMAR